MKILGIDYGKSKIGLAIGDSETKLSEPFTVLSSAKFLPSLKLRWAGKVPAFAKATVGRQISKLIEENNIEKIVVGVPGGKIEEEIRKFGDDLEKSTGFPIEYYDETLSTQDAQRLMIDNNKKKKYRREMEDAVAAAIMLQYYLEESKDGY